MEQLQVVIKGGDGENNNFVNSNGYFDGIIVVLRDERSLGHIDVIIEAGGWIVLRYIGRRRMATPTVYRVGCIDCKITRLKSIKVAIIGKIRETTWIGFCLSLIYFNKFKYNSLVLRGSD